MHTGFFVCYQNESGGGTSLNVMSFLCKKRLLIFRIMRAESPVHCQASGTGQNEWKRSPATAVIPAGQEADLCPPRSLCGRPSVTVCLQIGSSEKQLS